MTTTGRPVGGMTVHAAGAGAVGVGGDVYAPITTNIFGADGPPFTVESLPDEAPPELADLVALREQPSKLLNTRRRVIPFAGRRGELACLARWRDEGPRRAAWLVHAPGGQGKTRLAVRAAEEAAAHGWTVGWARHRADTPLGGRPLRDLPPDGLPLGGQPLGEVPMGRAPGGQAPAWTGAAWTGAAGTGAAGTGAAGTGGVGLLVVVDYAERWPPQDLQALLAWVAGRRGRLRVLLLGRSLAGWGAADAVCEELGIVAERPLALEPVAIGEDGRRELFEAACRRFAQVYGVRAPEPVRLPGGAEDLAYGSVLTVHMAALAVVDAHARGDRPPERAGELSRWLLHRERRYWGVLHGEKRALGMARAAFVAAVTGALPSRDGVGLLDRVGLPGASGMTAQQIVDGHSRCYPAAVAGMVLEPFTPDRLAEDFIGLCLPGDQPESLADPWCADVLAGLFEEAPRYTGRGLIVLAAAAVGRPHVVEALRQLLRGDPGLAVAGGGAALLAVTPLADVGLAREISGRVLAAGMRLDPSVAVHACGIHQLATLVRKRGCDRSG
ncbi:hypothetical protein ACQPZX_36065 [Actinoplanes sp. CA-142083]|uniref:hypothetical protein n=1 Tax=Actinoplanes sp. CA-142083 TaxID=3239903 RepID=UPI003D8F08D8